MLEDELRRYHAIVYRALRDNPDQPREAKSDTADMCLRAADALRAIGNLSRLSADHVSALPAWAVSRFCDIQQCVDAEHPRSTPARAFRT